MTQWESADEAGTPTLPGLVVVVRVAVVEVLVEGVVAGKLRLGLLVTLPCRRPWPISGETAPGLACTGAAVTVWRLSVAS
jgi:hypothetical protein